MNTKSQLDMGRGTFVADELRKKVQTWLATSGRTQLETASREVEQTRESLRNKVRVDPKTFNDPVTL